MSPIPRDVRARFLLLASLFPAWMLTSCGASHTAPKILRLPLLSPFVPDPAQASPADLWPLTLVSSGLFKFDNNMNVVPDLAVSLPTISKDGKTYSITIRRDGRFDDGTRVVARDVKWSFTRAVAAHEHSRPAWRDLHDINGAFALHAGSSTALGGVRVEGRHRLAIRLIHPDPWFLIDLALPPASVLERQVVSQGRRWWLKGGNAGPFRISSVTSQIVLSANRYYDDGPPALRTVILRRVASYREGRDLYRRHGVDATPISPSSFSRAQGRAGFQWFDTDRAFYLRMPPALSKRTRIPLARALDTAALAAPANPVDPMPWIVPRQIVPSYNQLPVTPFAFHPLPFGLPLPKEMEIQRPGGPVGRMLVRWIQRSWRVRLRITSVPTRSTFKLVSIDIRLPSEQLWLQKAGSLVFANSNTKFEKSLSIAQHDIVSQGLAQAWTADNRAEMLVLSTAVLVPIGLVKQGYLISPRVQGLSHSSFGLEPSNENWATVSTGE